MKALLPSALLSPFAHLFSLLPTLALDFELSPDVVLCVIRYFPAADR